MKFVLAAGTAMMLLCSGAFAAQTVAGWEIDRDGDGDCRATHVYKDADDNDAENAVVFGTFKARDGRDVMIISVAYANWNWDKGQEVKADFLINDTVYAPDRTWTAPNDKALVATFTEKVDALMRSFGKGKTITLRFDGDEDEEASFEIPNVGQAIGALQFCQQSKPQ